MSKGVLILLVLIVFGVIVTGVYFGTKNKKEKGEGGGNDGKDKDAGKVKEYPPIGIAPAKDWVRPSIMTDSYTTTLSGAAYGNGTYKATVTEGGVYAFGSDSSEWPPSGAFDKSGGAKTGGRNGYHTSSGSTTFKLDIELPDSIVLKSYKISMRDECCSEQVPKDWTIEGKKKGGTTWEKIDTKVNETNWKFKEEREYNITSNTKDFDTYRLNVTANNGDSSYSHIGEWKLFGRKST